MEKMIVELLKAESRPAMGCTEPVSIAVVSNIAVKYLGKIPEKLSVKLSLSVYKNAFNVKIPKVNKAGIALSAALGCFAKEQQDLMNIFAGVDDTVIKKAEKFVQSGKVSAEFDEQWQGLVLEATAKSGNEEVVARIEHAHTNVVWVKKDGVTILDNSGNDDAATINEFASMTVMELIALIEKLPIEELIFLEDGVNMNLEVAKVGLEKELGLKIGAGIDKLIKKGILANDLINNIKMTTAAGSDARMSGYAASVMTSGGSGNQGIALFLAIYLTAKHFNVEREKYIRALAIGHAINVLTKNHTGKLMSVCGCAVGTGIGVSVGVCWMLDGTERQITGSFDNFIANLLGIICDGAKESCSFKLASATGEAVLAALLSLEGVSVNESEALIGGSTKMTLEILRYICIDGMKGVEKAICEVLM